MGYYYTPIDEASLKLCSNILLWKNTTINGHPQIADSHDIFQQVMIAIFGDLDFDFVITYIDAITITNKDYDLSWFL